MARVSFICFFIGLGLASAWMPTKARRELKMSSVSNGRSKSIPFLLQPANLDGTLAGDEGFDPLGLSAIQDIGVDLYWMREAELKHARIAMIASLGFIAQEKGLFLINSNSHNQVTTFYEFSRTYPSSVGFFIVLVGFLELFSGISIMITLFSSLLILLLQLGIAITEGRKSDRAPGDYGFNPLG